MPFDELLFINMCVSLLSGLIPVPGGIGVTEGGLIFGLTSVGVPQEAAFAAVILYRLVDVLPPADLGLLLAALARAQPARVRRRRPWT